MPTIVREDATVMEATDSDVAALKERLVVLTSQLNEAESLKRAANKKFNDDIKDLKEEIKGTLELIKGASDD